MNPSVATNNFLTRVGHRIRRLRKINEMTVQELADLSSVSRRLMTQIELGQANPSLTTVDRIARALGSDFAALSVDIAGVAEIVRVNPPGSESLIWSGAAGSRAWLLVATEARGGAELWRWVLSPGDVYTASPDPDGSEELFEVHSGTLTITTIEASDAHIISGGSARLKSDRQYAYENRCTEPVSFTRIVVTVR